MSQITCPNCGKDCAVTTAATRRPTSELAKGAALVFLTLATAAVGSYAAIRYFAYELVSRTESRAAVATPQDEHEARLKQLRDNMMRGE